VVVLRKSEDFTTHTPKGWELGKVAVGTWVPYFLRAAYAPTIWRKSRKEAPLFGAIRDESRIAK
jgi:hypothetical protein